MTLDVGDEEAVKKVRKRHNNKRDVEKEDIRSIMRLPGGRAFLWRLLSQCGVYHENLYPESPGAAQRQEGRRAMGLWVIKEIEDADPHAYARMRDEASNMERKND